MNKLIYLFILSAILTVGCSPNATTTNAPTTRSDAVKTTEMQVSPPEIDAAEPAIAVDADGIFYVVYVAHNADKSADIYLQKFDSQKKSTGEKVRVNPNAGEATAWRGDPPTIVLAADKKIYIGWTKSVKTTTQSGRDLCLSVSRDNGKSFDAPIKVNDDIAPASHGMHSLAVGKNNQIFMAWLDERNIKSDAHAENLSGQNSGYADFQFVKVHHNSNQTEIKKDEKQEAAEPNSEIFFAASIDGGKTFSANVKLSSDVCPCCKTSLIVAPDDRIYASWRQVLNGNFRHFAVASSNDAGKTFSAPTIVSDDRWKLNACPVSGAALAIDKNNSLKIFWFTAGEAGKPGLYFSRSNDGAKTFAPRELLSEDELSGTPVAVGGTLIWSANGKISAKKDGGNIEPVADGEFPAAIISGDKFFAAFVKKEKEKRGVWLAEF